MIDNIKYELANKFENSFNSKIFFTVRGSENIHIYFWICKDLGWILNNKVLGMTFGTITLLWVLVLTYHAICKKNYEDLYFILSMFLWLGANYIWMLGNLIYDTDVFRFGASCIMMCGIVTIAFYFCFLKNKTIFQPKQSQIESYNSNKLICRFSSINTWRRYEFIHMFFWLLKDYCWCSQDKVMWLVGAIPTIFVSVDLIYITSKNKKLFVDLMHYLAQLLWVSSNIIWAFVELYQIGTDIPTNFKDRVGINGRIFASYVLFSSLIPIFTLYLIWIPLSYANIISGNVGEKNNKTIQNEILPEFEMIENPIIK
jgi:hypothetical protein